MKTDILHFQDNTEIFNFSALERILKIPKGAISLHNKGHQKLSKKHVYNLDLYCSNPIYFNSNLVFLSDGKIKALEKLT